MKKKGRFLITLNFKHTLCPEHSQPAAAEWAGTNDNPRGSGSSRFHKLLDYLESPLIHPQCFCYCLHTNKIFRFWNTYSLFLSCTSHMAISFGRSRTGQKFWSCAVVVWTEVPGKTALARWNGCVCLCDYLCLFLWILKTICSNIMFFHFLYCPHEKSWTKTILDFL